MPTGIEESTPAVAQPIHKMKVQWPYKLRKNLKAFLASPTGFSVAIALLSTVVIIMVLSSRFLTGEDVVKSQVATRDIRAEQNIHVENVEETQRSRYEARQNVVPIYKAQPTADKIIMDRLVDRLETIRSLREDDRLSLAEKQARLSEEFAGQRFDPTITKTLLTTMNWRNFFDTTIMTTENIIDEGVRSENLTHNRGFFVRQSVPNHSSLTSQEIDALVFLIGTELRPTQIIDERLTEEARDTAASRVEPVIEVFPQGNIIVRKGEKINDVQIAALQQQGNLFAKNRFLAVVGVSILTVSLLSIVWIYLYRFEHSNFFKPAYAGLLATLMVASTAGLTLLLDLQPNLAIELFPVGIMSLMLCIFTHPRIAILTSMIVLLLCGITLKLPLESLSVLVISSLVGIFVLSRKPIPKDRNDIILAGLGIGLSRGIVILAISLIYDSYAQISDLSLMYRAWVGILSGVFTGIITLGALPIVENWFKLVTPYTLLELGNHDKPLLRRMQMEAPGTFHHSLMVATLAEAAAEAIEANPILARVGALYHDIGKMKRPLFFVENQAYFGVENPHDKLTPRLSKMVVTAHPRDGVEMAKQWGLPKVIARFMPEHHGTLTAGYFYNKAVLEEGEENVNKAQFRYPGPKPQSKETAIVMLADACESAVRALKNPTLAQVEERVDKIIKQRVDDAQFNECAITFQDIQVVRDTFIRILRGIQHNRIEYQQNVLAELGKKPGQDAKLLAQGLKTIPEQQPTVAPVSVLPLAAVKEQNGQPGNGHSGDPLIELDSLADANKQQPDQEPGPSCC